MRLSPKDIQLTCRQIHFDLPDNYQAVWIADEIIESHFYNILSVTFDMAETLIMRAINRAKPLLHDDTLRENVSVFLRQEGSHRRLHGKLNQALQHYYARIPAILHRLEQEYAEFLDPHADLGKVLRLSARFENLAAALARRFLRKLPERYTQMQPLPAVLFGYHAAEELEHKGICFDCYSDIYKHTPAQAPSEIEEWAVFNKNIYRLVLQGVTYFLKIDRFANGDATPINLIEITETIFGEQGILPPQSDYYQYRQKDFHPWQIDDRSLITEWDSRWSHYYLCKKKSSNN